MDKKDTSKETEIRAKESGTLDELANLKKVSDINNYVNCQIGELVIESASPLHIKELSELWANLASIQQLVAPETYNFKNVEKNWQLLVSEKFLKNSNILLVAHNNNDNEIRGFLYMQTIKIPSSELVVKGVVEDIYTKPQYRKQGIASKLLDVALDWASKQHIKHVDLISLIKARDFLDFCLKYIKVSNTEVKLDLVTI